MAILNFVGWETGSSTEISASLGTNSVQSSVVRTGGYALRCNPTTTGNGYHRINVFGANGKLTAAAAGTMYITFYFRIATLPASNEEPFAALQNSGADRWQLRVTSAGVVKLYSNYTPALVATGSTVLSTGVWYRIDFSGGNGASAAYELKIDGVSEFSGTANAGSGNNETAGLGKTTNVNGQTVDFYYDDLVMSDSGFATTPEVRLSKPIGSGNYSSWTDGSGSTYAEVDDAPHDTDGTYIQNTSGTSVAHTFDMQAFATISAVGTIAAVKPCMVIRETSSTTTSGGLRLRSGSTDNDTTAVDIGNTTYAFFGKVLETDPATSSAWTESGFDGIEVGPYKGTDDSSLRATAVYAMILTDGVAAGSVTSTPGVASLSLSAFAPTVSVTNNQLVTPDVLAAVLAAFAPTASTPQTVTPATVTLTTTGLAPTVTVSADQVATPDTLALSLTAFAPTVSTPVTVTPGVLALTITTFAPAVSTPVLCTPATATLATTSFAPSIALPVLATLSTAGLTISPFAPSVATPSTVTPSTAALSTSGFSPSVTTPQTITPGALALSLTAFSPTVSSGAGALVVPATASLVLTTYRPLIAVPETHYTPASARWLPITSASGHWQPVIEAPALWAPGEVAARWE